MGNVPRDYQIEAIEKCVRYFDAGKYAGIVQLPTGTGKSLVQQELIRRHFPINKYRSILIGGLSRSLNFQALDGVRFQYPETAYPIERNGLLVPGSGLIMADHDDSNARMVVASAQTVGPKTLKIKKRILENDRIEAKDVTRTRSGGIILSPNSKRQYLMTPRFDEILKHGRIDLWIHDECFAAGTMVDGRPIETLKVGDFVTAFNEATQQFEKKKIVRLFAHRPKGAIVKVVVGGTTIICTANHPFYTQRGWIAAGELNDQTKILRFDLHDMSDTVSNQCQRASWQGIFPEEWISPVLFAGLHSRREEKIQSSACAPTKLLSSELFPLWGRSGIVQPNRSRQNRHMEDVWQDVLFNYMYAGDYARGIVNSHGGDKSQICFGTYEAKQPNAQTWGTRQNAANTSSYSVETSDSRRQRYGVYTATKGLGSGAGGWLAHGIRGGYTETEAGGLSDSVQNRYRAPWLSDGYRSGRSNSLSEATCDSRSKENRFSEWVGVDSVAVLKQSSDGTYGGVLPDGLVYNLEVADLHTYTANGIVVHNCHHAPADGTMWMVRQLNAIYEHLSEEPLRHVGFTATPMRNDERALSNVYEIMYYQRDYQWAVENGYVVPLEDEPIVVDVLSEHGRSERLKAIENWMDRVYQGYMDHIHGQRLCTVTFVGPINGVGAVQASRELQAYFCDHGIPTAHVDGEYWVDPTGKKRPNSERKELWNAMNDGRIKHITNFGVMIEGIDVPVIDTVQILRAVNPVTFTQMIGRAVRLYPGKVNARIIDYTGQELVQMMHGELSGVKIDSFTPYVEAAPVEDTDEKEDEEDFSGGNLRDLSQPGYVQGVNNIYKKGKIKRHSGMVWFDEMPGSPHMSMSVTRREHGSSAFLITTPNHTKSDWFKSITEQYILPEKIHNTAMTLYEVYRSFTFWHTREGFEWASLPNGFSYKPHVVVDGSYKEMLLEFDRIEEYASRYAKTLEGYDKSIAAKNNSWRRGTISEKQARFFTGLFPTLDPEQYSAGQASSMICHALCETAVLRILTNAENAVRGAISGKL